jgi:hypothetical protein
MGNSEVTPPPPPPDPRMMQIYNTSTGMARIQEIRPRIPENTDTEILKVKLLALIDRSKVRLVMIQDKFFHVNIWVQASEWSQLEVRFYCEALDILESKLNVNGFSRQIAPTPGMDVLVEMDLRSLQYDQIFSSHLHHIGIDFFALSNSGIVQRSLFQLTRVREELKLKLKKQVHISNGTQSVVLDLYGIGGKDSENTCLICLSEIRDTMILPCRHVCLCNYCSIALSSQIRKSCPVCRGNIIELVRIKST